MRGAKISVPVPQRETLTNGVALMRELLTSLPAALAFLTGPDLVIEFANDACFRLAGGRNLLGRPMTEALPELADQAEILVQGMNSGEPARSSEAGIPFAPGQH